MRPVGDFKRIRGSLPPPIRVQVDNMMAAMARMAEYMCELEPQYQSILVDLGADSVLTFAMSRQKHVEIYAMLEQPNNDITQQTKQS